MADFIHSFLVSLPTFMLLFVLVISIGVLGKSADIMVEQAVHLAAIWRLPAVIVGATIVSLGTTLPEVVVSVLAAMQGSPGIALGNAVGSIICDTGLILGLAAVLAPLPLNRSIVNRQGWVQVAACFMLVLACIPFTSITTMFELGGRMPRWVGFIFLGLLIIYLWLQVKWGMVARDEEVAEERTQNIPKITILMILSFAFLAVSSEFLIGSATEIALRFSIPESVIAVTLVAFGTSLPELVTAVAAVRKGHGEIAVGNVIGADILNVFLVAGASASVTPGGLLAGPEFFTKSFPIMLIVIGIFRLGVTFSGKHLHKSVGYLLLLAYLLVVILNLTEAMG